MQTPHRKAWLTSRFEPRTFYLDAACKHLKLLNHWLNVFGTDGLVASLYIDKLHYLHMINFNRQWRDAAEGSSFEVLVIAGTTLLHRRSTTFNLSMDWRQKFQLVIKLTLRSWTTGISGWETGRTWFKKPLFQTFDPAVTLTLLETYSEIELVHLLVMVITLSTNV